ncbi:MAG: hypothetical protein KA712_00800 [Myxococcales bacterium]|nr:hypothetical protein [Myxococcales bacterium]
MQDAAAKEGGAQTFEIPHPSSPPSANWKTIFENEAEDFGLGFLTVWGRKWFAPGKEVIVEGEEEGGSPVVHRFAQRFIQRVSQVGDQLLAVGSPFLIMARRSDQWVAERTAAPRTRDAKRRFANILSYADIIRDAQGRLRTTVSGPVFLYELAPRKPQWSVVSAAEHGSLLSTVRAGPTGALLCEPTLWRWSTHGHGWYICEDGRVFSYIGANSVALGNIPAECAPYATGANKNEFGYAFICSENVMSLRVGASQWRSVTGPEDLNSVALGARCIFANSRSRVWKHCDE